MEKVVTFGELMLRLMPEGYGRFLQAQKFDAQFGGAEANVAVSLSNFGIHSLYVTRLPENPLAQAAINSLRRYGVDTSCVSRGGNRLGIYFLEKGASQRPSLCVYDRAHSAFSESAFVDYDWKKIFSGAKFFHITGVTPALSKNCAQSSIQACELAKKMGVTVSCDLNYRSKLWSIQKARATMKNLCKYVDLCIANEDDAENIFGIKTEGTSTGDGIINSDGYKKTILKMVKKFGFKQVAITLRKSQSASVNNWSAIFFDGNQFHFSREYKINIVERVGSGDAFAAGLIYSLCKKMTPADCVEFATAAGAIKHSIEGDYNIASAEEVIRLAHSSGTGRVIR